MMGVATQRHGRRNGRTGLTRLLLAAVLTALPASCRSDQPAEAAGETHLDVGCMLDHVERPSEAFHYSYKYADSSTQLDAEAAVTPQTMDIQITDPSGVHKYHGVRSDPNSWNAAVFDLASLNFAAMTGRLGGYDGTSVIRRQVAEPVNGYTATTYIVDSRAASADDRQTFTTLFGPGSFDKGTVSMGSDGCAVRVLLDEGISQPNGSVEKRHYEINRRKE